MTNSINVNPLDCPKPAVEIIIHSDCLQNPEIISHHYTSEFFITNGNSVSVVTGLPHNSYGFDLCLTGCYVITVFTEESILLTTICYLTGTALVTEPRSVDLLILTIIGSICCMSNSIESQS